jgi:alpha-methylacyl-CoA racemase
MSGAARQGPLAGLRVVEMPAIGPVPLCATLLADLGAEVLCIQRPDRPARDPAEPTRRGRAVLPLDLRAAGGKAVAAALVDAADGVVEGFRPGVMERLGLGPQECLGRNSRLVYGRMTGWGQEGPLARAAGHDINYIALSGALHAIGRAGDRPVPPLNLVGDYGGGALYLAFGMAAAFFERERSGRGQVVDAAMLDGIAGLMAPLQGMLAAGRWTEERGANLLDGGAPWYDTYATKDHRYVSVGALEPQFWAELLARLGIDPATLPSRDDRAEWPTIRMRLDQAFRVRTRDEWAAHFEGSDACVAPVLTLSEAPAHAHHRARGTYVEIDGRPQAAPAPRFGRTPGATGPSRLADGDDAAALLRLWNLPEAVIGAMPKVPKGA